MHFIEHQGNRKHRGKDYCRAFTIETNAVPIHFLWTDFISAWPQTARDEMQQVLERFLTTHDPSKWPRCQELVRLLRIHSDRKRRLARKVVPHFETFPPTYPPLDSAKDLLCEEELAPRKIPKVSTCPPVPPTTTFINPFKSATHHVNSFLEEFFSNKENTKPKTPEDGDKE